MSDILITPRPALANQLPSRVGKPNYRIYRNLHEQAWSVQVRTPNGWRVGYTATVLIADCCTFSVSMAGRDRVRRTRRKCVHAFVLAESVSFPSTNTDFFHEADEITGYLGSIIRYDPYGVTPHFTCNGEPVGYAHAAYFNPHGTVFGQHVAIGVSRVG